MISTAEQKPELSKYELHEEIGAGGMATVYRATDRRLGREVAVKVIHRHLRESSEVAARFASEAKAVAKLKHPNIVEVYDVSDEDEPERYLVVELVRGTTLRKLLQKIEVMPAEVAAALGLELAQALGHAHEAGVIHRDVKPENVLVEISGDRISTSESQDRSKDERGPKVMITDFGIAKLLDAQGVTSTGQVLGSPAHMAPEQIEGGDVSPRSDIFALGVLLYECMVGHLPFEGKNPAQVLRRVLDGIYPPADRERQSVGARWSAILARALANAPKDRFLSIEDFVTDVRAELDALGFDDPHRELGEFLADPEAYREPYEERIVQRLVARGEKARAQGDVPLAAALFNRALAFRPTDAALIARVTRLARGQRLKENAKRVASIIGLSALLGGAAYGITRAASQERGAHETPSATVAASNPAPTGQAAPTIGPEPAPSAKPAESGSKKKTFQLKTPTGPWPPASGDKPGPTGELRAVRFSITPGNALLKIDGSAPTADWFGATKQLEVGRTYRFEFVPPPEETCCTASSLTDTIPPGDGAHSIQGRLRFKDARLRIGKGPQGGMVTCATLFPGQQLLSGQIVKTGMQKPKVSGSCMLTAPNSTPKQKSVTLRAGETADLTWQ